MLYSILIIILFSTCLAIPLSLVNAKYFHGKHEITSDRIFFVAASSFIFSLIITHTTLAIITYHDTYSWVFYILGLFCCIPTHHKSLAKECNSHDHLMDGLGILISVIGYILVIMYWDSFFSDPYKAGFLHDFTSIILSIRF